MQWLRKEEKLHVHCFAYNPELKKTKKSDLEFNLMITMTRNS